MTDQIKKKVITLHGACHDQLKEIAIEDLIPGDNEQIKDMGMKEIIKKAENMDHDGDTMHKITGFLEIFFKE